MKTATQWGVVVALVVAGPATADYLPDPEAAAQALWRAPAVEAVRAERAAQDWRSRGLEAGRDEWTVNGELARRRVDGAASGGAEWGVQLARPVRLPARASADRALASAQRAYVEASLGEALHEAGRELVTLWFEWLDEASQTDLWQAQRALADQQIDVVNKRIRLGEAARAERVQAEAARAQVVLQAEQAVARAQLARQRLDARFPGVTTADAPTLPATLDIEGTADAHVAAVLEHDHELQRARRRAELDQAMVRQLARRDSVDPHVGVYYRNEAGGNEHVLGVNVGLTLPGRARAADREAAARLSEGAALAAERIEQRLRQDAANDFADAVFRAAHWRQAERAADALAEAARLAARAYSLGEGSLDQVLASQRLALEARLVARRAQVTALAAHARLQLDAHRLWPLDVDEDAHHAHP